MQSAPFFNLNLFWELQRLKTLITLRCYNAYLRGEPSSDQLSFEPSAQYLDPILQE
jgi:hypothetical protein